MVRYGASGQYRLCLTGLGHLNSRRTYNMHYWFKSNVNLSEWVDLASWWSCIREGLGLRPAQSGLYTCFVDQHFLFDCSNPFLWNIYWSESRLPWLDKVFFWYVWMELGWSECHGHSGVWTSLNGLFCSESLLYHVAVSKLFIWLLFIKMQTTKYSCSRYNKITLL